MQPLTASHPPSPHGDASVPISTLSPVCMNSASVKCLSTCCLDEEKKKTVSQSSACSICRLQTVLIGPVLFDDRDAQIDCKKGLSVINRPAAWLARPTNERRTSRLMTFSVLNRRKSATMSATMTIMKIMVKMVMVSMVIVPVTKNADRVSGGDGDDEDDGCVDGGKYDDDDEDEDADGADDD